MLKKILPAWVYVVLVIYCGTAIWYPFMNFVGSDEFKNRYSGNSLGMYFLAALLFLIAAVLTYAAFTFEQATKEEERKRKWQEGAYDRLLGDFESPKYKSNPPK